MRCTGAPTLRTCHSWCPCTIHGSTHEAARRGIDSDAPLGVALPSGPFRLPRAPTRMPTRAVTQAALARQRQDPPSLSRPNSSRQARMVVPEKSRRQGHCDERLRRQGGKTGPGQTAAVGHALSHAPKATAQLAVQRGRRARFPSRTGGLAIEPPIHGTGSEHDPATGRLRVHEAKGRRIDVETVTVTRTRRSSC